MKIEHCKICGKNSKEIFQETILKSYLISYFQCINCGFVQTEKPFWLPEAYKDSMNLGDTGQVKRNFINSIKVKNIIDNCLDPKKHFLDYAGGYGLFTRTMRDFGYSFYWEDLYTSNLLAKGFSTQTKSIDWFEAITVFECFEHWENPIIEISNLFSRTDTIIFTTNLISNPLPSKDWWYYGFDHGQHISFFSYNTMKFLETKFDCILYSKAGVHILSKRKINNLLFITSILKAKILLYLIGIQNSRSLTALDHKFLIDNK
jgi:hypothetical protein